MMFTDQAKASFSAMLLKEYGIEISRDSEILPILYLMHNYEEKMGATIASGFGFMDAAGTQLTEVSAKLEAHLEQVKTENKAGNSLPEPEPFSGNPQETKGGSIKGLLLLIAALQIAVLIFLFVRG